ncbi:hypothetical protein [Actinacidiphila soli]|uniref:hypothetical protein n=1 Tax=Actinacidiphila soli TaxID=2487275 RepID=UPI000FC9B6E8|nr:hypothetical protein [Actinacidiphila soli]
MNDSGFLALRFGRRARSLGWAGWGTSLVVCALLGYSVLTTGLHGDIRYVLACLRSGGAAGYSPSEIFTHRPFFYRWFIAGMDAVSAGPTGVREAIIRLMGIVLCVVAGLGLRSALVRSRRPLPRREATLTAAMVALSLALAPAVDYLQPEWTAALLSVVAVAVVFRVDRPWVAAAVASVPLGLAVMMKYSTAATALMALLVIFVADRVRALLLAAATTVASVALFGFSVWSGSHEWQWARDMPKINPGALSRTGIDPASLLDKTVVYLADRAFLSPVLALLPAALLLVLARQADRRKRIEWVVTALLICLGCVAAVAVQGNWFAYHSAALPVCAAALWGLAVARWYGWSGRPPLCFVAVSVLYGVLAPFASAAPAWLQSTAVAWLAAAVALAAALADVRLSSEGRAGRRVPVALVALAGVVCLAAPVWPSAPHLRMDGKVLATNTEYQQQSEAKAAKAAELRREIPAGDPVLYLAFGDLVYYIGHPAQCRYPVPTFLQRTANLPDVDTLTSVEENARCITENPAPYAVLQPSWFSLKRVDKTVIASFRKLYVCPQADPKQTVVCRLR